MASELDQVGRKLGETDTVFVGELDIFDRGWHSEEVFSSEDQYMAGTASGDGLADHTNRSTGAGVAGSGVGFGPFTEERSE